MSWDSPARRWGGYRPARWLLTLAVAVTVVGAQLSLGIAAPTLAATGWKCTTSAARGSCGPYDNYRYITGTTSSTRIGNNVWAPVSGWRQTLRANNPGDWQVTANMPAGNTSVVSYPSVGANYGRITDVPTPLSRFSLIQSAFTEHMNKTARTSAWAAYDIWLGRDGCTGCASHEVMIQHDFANNGACTTVAKTTFAGRDGNRQPWHLCKYGSELIWKLGADEQHKVSEQTGVVHIKGMLLWLVSHGYLPSNSGLWLIGYGWEICSTGSRAENFDVSEFRLWVGCTKQGCK